MSSISSHDSVKTDDWMLLDRKEEADREEEAGKKEEADKKEEVGKEEAADKKEEVEKEEEADRKEEVEKEEERDKKEEVEKEEEADKKEEEEKEEMTKEEVENKEMDKAEMDKEEVGKEEVGKEEVGKEEAGKEEAGKEKAGKEEAAKEEAAKEDVAKEEVGMAAAEKKDEEEEVGKEPCKEAEAKDKDEEPHEREGAEEERREGDTLDQARGEVAPFPCSATRGEGQPLLVSSPRMLVERRWVLVLLFLLYSVAVYYISHNWQRRTANDDWESKFESLVAEKVREAEEERRSLVNLTRDLRPENGQADTEAQTWNFQQKLAFIGAIAAVVTTYLTREAFHIFDFRSACKADMMKEAVEAALTRHYRAKPIDDLGWRRLTYIFQGIGAAQQDGRTLVSPPLCFPSMRHLGIKFTVWLHVKGGISLCVNMLQHSGKAVMETPSAQTKEQALDLLRRKCCLRIIPQGADAGLQPREIMLNAAIGNFHEMIGADEVVVGHWIRGDMLAIQTELVL